MVKLKGKNQINKFKQIADKLTSRIASHEGVGGIVLVGGLVRGFVDRFSDLDIFVFLNKKDEELVTKISNMGVDEGKLTGIDVDLEIHVLEDFKKLKWDETDKWDFCKAKIVYDPDGNVEKVFREKSKIPKDFWVKRIVVYAEYLKWYCCPPKNGVGTVAEAWIERGNLAAAHYCLSYAVDLLLKMLFALNEEFLPSPKWRIFCSHNLKWLPEDYEALIREIMRVEDLSSREFKRRLEDIQKLWRRVVPKIENETGLALEQLSKYYVREILHQTGITSHGGLM
jgi:predicted nucleotidyltransferase